MSAADHLGIPRLPREEGRLHATPRFRFPASTPQALSVSELRKHFSWRAPGRITALDNADLIGISENCGKPPGRRWRVTRAK